MTKPSLRRMVSWSSLAALGRITWMRQDRRGWYRPTRCNGVPHRMRTGVAAVRESLIRPSGSKRVLSKPLISRRP